MRDNKKKKQKKLKKKSNSKKKQKKITKKRNSVENRFQKLKFFNLENKNETL